MANKYRGQSTVKIGGRTFIARIGFNELAEFEKISGGRSFGDILKSGSISGSMDLLWIAIKWQDRKLTIKALGTLLTENPEDFQPALEAVSEAVEAAMPKTVDEVVGDDSDGEQPGNE